MITSAIYSAILEAVESEIQLPDGWIGGSKTEDATDARHILCGYLFKHGMSSAQIQQCTGLKKSTVNKLLAGLNARLSRRRMTYVWWLQVERKLNARYGDGVGLCEYFRNDKKHFTNQQNKDYGTT